MALARCHLVVTDEAGNLVNGASVTVQREAAGFPLASVYSDRDGLVALGNPFTAADGADAGFHAAGGAYKITATLGAFTREWRYVAIGLAAEQDDADGASLGFSYTFNAATSGDPGAGAFLLNHATFASVTALNISETDALGNALATLIATWDDSTSTIRGRLLAIAPASGAFFALDITGTITDSGGYDTFSATPVQKGGTINNGDACFVFFAPKGDKGDAGVGGSAGEFTQLQGGLTPRENLAVAYVSVTQVDIDATAVTLFDSGGSAKRFTSLNETLAITSSGVNGLDTGAEGSSRWYYIWAIGKADGTLDGLLSESDTAPTMPSGYTFKGLIGNVYNNASSNFLVFYQRDNIISDISVTVLSNGIATTYTAVSLAAAIPPNARAVFGQMAIGVSSGTGTPFIGLAPAGSGTTATYSEIFVQNPIAATGTGKLYLPFESPVITPQQLVYYVGGTNPQGTIVITGWKL